MYVLGLYSDGDYFKVSLISKKGRKSRIEFLREFKKDVTNLNALKKILDQKVGFFSREVEVVSSLPADEIFIKKIVIPLVGERKVKKALQFQLSSDEVYSDEDRFFVPLFKKSGKETIVTLHGYTKEAMEGHLQDVKMLGINSEWVSSVSRGLERFVQFFAKETDPFFLFHLGWETSSFYYIENEEVKRESCICIGLKNIIDAIQKDNVLTEPVDMKKISDLFCGAIEENKEGTATQIFFELEREISRAWTYILETENSAPKVNKVLFTGYAEFAETLKPYLPPIDFETLSITPHLEFSSSQITTYAIEIGLALDRIVSDKQTLQLCVGKFTPLGQKKKAQKYLYRYAGLSLISAVMVFLTIDAFFIKKREVLKNRYEGLANEINAFNTPLKAEIVFNEKDFLKNRKLLSKAIKQQKQDQRMLDGPMSMVSYTKWLVGCRKKGFTPESVEYKVLERPNKDNPSGDYITEFKTLFKSSKGKPNMEQFKRIFQSFEHKKYLCEDPEVYEDGNLIVHSMRVKT